MFLEIIPQLYLQPPHARAMVQTLAGDDHVFNRAVCCLVPRVAGDWRRMLATLPLCSDTRALLSDNPLSVTGMFTGRPAGKRAVGGRSGRGGDDGEGGDDGVADGQHTAKHFSDMVTAAMGREQERAAHRKLEAYVQKEMGSAFMRFSSIMV